MKLKMNIHKIKCINNLEIEFPTEKGLYAITGQNGSGKSTIVACASSVFFNMRMNDYFGKTDEDAYITFELGNSKRSWKKTDHKWIKASDGVMNIKGFYEGSLIFGNRFRDTSYDKLRIIETIDANKLIPANDFIRKNLGQILQGDSNFYEKLWFVSSNYEKFDGTVFFYEKKWEKDKSISYVNRREFTH